MITVSIVMLLALASSVIGYAMMVKGGVPDSVSEIAYIIPHWAFSSWMMAMAFLLLPMMMERLDGGWSAVGFGCVAGLMFVAASPFYKSEEALLHYLGGVLSAICVTLVTGVLFPVLLASWPLWVVAMALARWRNWCFWGESLMLVLLVVALAFC